MRHASQEYLFLEQIRGRNVACHPQSLDARTGANAAPSTFAHLLPTRWYTTLGQRNSAYPSPATQQWFLRSFTTYLSLITFRKSSEKLATSVSSRSCQWQGSKAKAPSRKRGPAKEYRPRKVWRLAGRLPKQHSHCDFPDSASGITSIGRSVPTFLQSAIKHFSTPNSRNRIDGRLMRPLSIPHQRGVTS